MARIELAYPKIPGSKYAPLERCIAFEKYDGTNLHWVWQRDLGWTSFGTRRDSFPLTPDGRAEFNSEHPGLEEAAEVFFQTLALALETVFHNHASYQDEPALTVFTEFLGPNSFAGRHRAEDRKELVLFDVQTSVGIIGPEQFVADFGQLHIARVVYRGKLTGKFTEEVRKGKYRVNEGVVCKGGSGGDDLWLVKVKTNTYRERLQQAFADNWEEYWE